MTKKPQPKSEIIAFLLIVTYIIIRLMTKDINPVHSDWEMQVDSRPSRENSRAIGEFFGIILNSLLIISILTLIINSIIAIFKGKIMFKRQKLFATSIYVSALIIILTFIATTQAIAIGKVQPSLLNDRFTAQDKPFGISFKQLLKNERLSLELTVPNKYETILEQNKYSNYYFNFSTDFPDHYQIDRGLGPYSVIRAIQPDSAITLALLVVPVDMPKSARLKLHESFQKNPLDSYKSLLKDVSYEDHILEQFKTSTNLEPYNSHISEIKIRSTNYIFHSFMFDEEVDNEKIPFTTYSYMTQNWGNTFSFTLNGPSILLNKKILEDAVFRTNYIFPEN